MKDVFSFKINLATWIPMVPVLWILVSDHYEQLQLVKDQIQLTADLKITNLSLASLTISCHETAIKTEVLSDFVKSRPGPPRITP